MRRRSPSGVADEEGDRGGPDTGVLLLIEFDGDPALFEPVFARWAPRQGFIESRLSDGTALVHWSSPLMYARAVKAEGDLLAALPFSTRAALYKWSRKDR
jgi:hypothetical protein